MAMLEEDATLTPRDIIVMVADIDSYSPFIQAVFGSAPADRYLPYAISDRRARLHFYESKGLITSIRNSGNQRRYKRDVLRYVAIIKIAQRIGIPLATIGEAFGVLTGVLGILAISKRCWWMWQNVAGRSSA